MKRALSLAFSAIEWFLPILGITRLGARRGASVALATAAHLVPLLGCVLAGWDPLAVLLAYWIELALLVIFLLFALIAVMASRLLGAGNGGPWEWDGLLGVFFRRDNRAGAAAFLAVWIAYFAMLMGFSLHALGAIAQSNYGLESLSGALARLLRGFIPPSGGLPAFLGSESASLALMVLSSVVSLMLQFFGGGRRAAKGPHDFVAKPLVRIMAMLIVFGISAGFEADRLPALSTVAVLAFAMALIDQRLGLIDHDFAPGGRGNPHFATPHGALFFFGFQIYLIIVAASFLISSFFVQARFARIQKNPVTAGGVIIRSRLPEDPVVSNVLGLEWWIVDVEYAAGWHRERRFVRRDIPVLAASDPKGGSLRVFHQAGDPRNAFVDVQEDRKRPRDLRYQGIILLVLGIAAWWVMGLIRFG